MNHLDPKIIQRIEEKLKRLNSLRPLPSSSVQKIKEQFQIEMTYNSNAIEGNTLTMKETFLVINEGITVKGKPLKDHIEAKSHKEALEYLYEFVEKKRIHTFSEQLIKNLHTIIIQDIERQFAGKYRNSNVVIVGADHIPPDALLVPQKMQELIEWIRNNQKKLHIIELAALLHHKLVNIHPFFDGNGRTSRLVMNLFLMQKDFPLVIILKNDRKKYYSTLQKADKKDYIPFILFISQAIERSLDIYLKTLTPMSKEKELFLSLSEISKKTPYSAKYLNLLARQGKIEAHKEGRDWVISQEAVMRYIKNRKRQRNI